MGISKKIVIVILLVLMAASALLWTQWRASTPRTVRLTPHDVELVYQELLPPDRQKEIAASQEEKKKFVADLKQLLALAQLAESEGFADRAEIQPQVVLNRDMVLASAYRKKYPDAKASEEEISQYTVAHPKDFDDFMQNNPRAQQAQGAQREALRKQFTDLKVLAGKAQKESLDRDDLTRLRLLLDRSQTLAGAYVNELRKDSDKLVSDADIENYYNEHTSDFDEVRVRHILISTQPQEPDEDQQKPDAKKPAPALTKEEAHKKAEQLLERVRKGEDFAKLAQENSDDPGSKSRGGEYDFFGKGRMVPEFEKAAFALQPGQVSDVVETQYGFHIIKLEERRSSQPPSADPKVKQEIVERLKDEKLKERIEQIASESSVVVPEDFNTEPKQQNASVSVQPDR
jgi:parvulin-like peptidyl-prolyl isomerase